MPSRAAVALIHPSTFDMARRIAARRGSQTRRLSWVNAARPESKTERVALPDVADCLARSAHGIATFTTAAYFNSQSFAALDDGIVVDFPFGAISFIGLRER